MRAEEGKGLSDLRLLVRRGYKLIDHFLEGLDVVVRLPLFDLDAETAGITQTRDGRGRDDHDTRAFDGCKPFVQLGNDPALLLGFRFPLVPRFQLHKDTPRIRFETEGEDIQPSQGSRMQNAGYSLGNPLSTVQHGQRPGRGACLRDLKGNIHPSFVLQRNKTRRFLAEQEYISHDDTGQQDEHERRPFDPARYAPGIAAVHLVETPVEPIKESIQPPGLLIDMMFPQ